MFTHKNLMYPISYPNFSNSSLGHWILRRNKGPKNVITDLNSCLSSVIDFQIRQDLSKLRKWTVLKLKNNFQHLSEWILELEENDKVIRMIGGANYKGTTSKDAKAILDNSDGAKCHSAGTHGHPRGHAFSKTEKKNVQEYSERGKKSGFLSRDDQDYIIHLALQSQHAQMGMEELNKGSTTVTVEVPITQLEQLHKLQQPCSDLPKAKAWFNRRSVTGKKEIKKVKLVLRHHENKFQDKNADVMVHTCFPVIR